MRQLIGYLLGISFSLSVAAAQDVQVSDAWVRATVPGQDSGSLQFSIASDRDSKLVAVSSPLAGAVEIHSMTHENGMMKMRAVPSLDLPAGKKIDLGAIGMHIMLVGLKHPLKEGEDVPFVLTLQFADRSQVMLKARAKVRSLTGMRDRHRQHDMPEMPGM